VREAQRAPAPIDPVGSMRSVTSTIVNHGGALLCTTKLDHTLSTTSSFSTRRTMTVQMTASARRVGGTPQHTIDVNRRHIITTDVPARHGGADSAPSPHELLPAMLASCVSTMIEMYARARDWELPDIAVDVEYDSSATPRRAEVTLKLPDGLTAEQIARLRRVADTCPVKRALEAGFTFTQEVALVAPALRPAA
jgi:putative redox protein